MKTYNFEGAILSPKLINFIEMLQEDDAASCDDLLELLNTLTDQYIEYDREVCMNSLPELRSVRNLHHLVLQIKQSLKGGSLCD